MRRVPSFVLVLLIAGAGCRSQQLAQDQDHIRHAYLELQTNQIMDNLIRARRGLPIVHLDYNHMTGTVTDTAAGGVSGSNTGVGATTAPFKATAAPTFAAVTRTFTNVFNYTASGMQVNQLTINAEPVLNAPEVYNAYLEFLKDPAHLVESAEPPPPHEALIVRCRERDCCDPDCAPVKCRAKVYYWVPCAYRGEFFALCLRAVALRGQATPVSPNFEVTVTGFADVKAGKVDGSFEAVVIFDKKVPDDTGYMIATVKGRRIDSPALLKLRKMHPKGKGEAAADDKAKDGEKKAEATPDESAKGKDGPATTDRMRLSFNVNTLNIDKLDAEAVIKELTGQKVALRLDNFYPSGTPTDRLLEDIRFQLELNRLGQFQLSR
jgi:hypothetical protein